MKPTTKSTIDRLTRRLKATRFRLLANKLKAAIAKHKTTMNNEPAKAMNDLFEKELDRIETIWTSPQDGLKFTRNELIEAAKDAVTQIPDDMRIMLNTQECETWEEFRDFAFHLWKDGGDIKTAWHALKEIDEKEATELVYIEWLTFTDNNPS